jgi:hypothetical protein
MCSYWRIITAWGTGSHQEVIHMDPALPAGVYYMEIKTEYGKQAVAVMKN